MLNEVNNSCVYYNVPTLSENIYSPVALVGIAVIKKADSQAMFEMILWRDRTVELASFTVAYRFSDAPIAMKDESHHFRKIMYNKEDINSKDYLILRCALPAEGIENGVSAVVSSLTLADGKITMFRQKDFVDPEVLEAGNGENAARPLADYLAYRSAAFMKKLAGIAEADWIDDKYFSDTPDVDSAKTKRVNYGERKSLKNFLIGMIATVVILGGIASGALYLINKAISPVEGTADVSQLLKGKQYAGAYKTVNATDNTEQLQEICREAATYYLGRSDYENAYLYAKVAPEAFDNEIVDMFVQELLKAERFDEAYDFVKTYGNYQSILQKVCESAVEGYLYTHDYGKAYTYGVEAPESLEDQVINHLLAYLLNGGKVDVETFAILDAMEDDEAYNSLAFEEITRFAQENDYVSAVIIANKVRNEAIRETLIRDLCSTGATYYMEREMLIEAATVIEDSADVLGEDWQSLVQAMFIYSTDKNIGSGMVYFSNLLGNDTSDFVIERGDVHLRNAVSKVYFLLTAEQKREYHANPFDLYKEAYLIKDGTLVGTQITNAVSVATSEFLTVVLLSDGTVTSWNNNGHNRTPEIPDAVNIVQIDAGRDHFVLLHDSGKVYAYGDNTYGQCSVRQWKDVVKVVTGADFTVGLCADGTLRACGSNLSGQCDVDRFTEVVDIAAADQTLFVLLADGTVKTVGDVSLGLKRADRFTDVKYISAAGNTIVAETHGGKFLMASGSIGGDSGSVSGWQNVEAFSAGAMCVGYVDTDGNIIVKGDGSPVN